MITVGLVTCGRPDLFERALSALGESGASLDYVILINGPDPKAEALARSRTPRVFSHSVTLSPGEARNFLVTHCQTDWIYFADDDAEVSPTLFTEFTRALSETPDADVFGGPNLTPRGSSAFQQACGDALGSRLGSYKCADRYSASQPDTHCDDAKLILCNLFIRTKLAKESPFPPDYVCAEENYALAKWREKGARFVYDPRLTVTHTRRATWSSFASQVYKYGRGRGRLIAKGECHWYHLMPLIGASSLATSVGLFSLVAYVCLIGAATARYSKTHDAETSASFAFAIIVIHAAYAVGICIGALIDAPMALTPWRSLRAGASTSGDANTRSKS